MYRKHFLLTVWCWKLICTAEYSTTLKQPQTFSRTSHVFLRFVSSWVKQCLDWANTEWKGIFPRVKASWIYTWNDQLYIRTLYFSWVTFLLAVHWDTDSAGRLCRQPFTVLCKCSETSCCTETTEKLQFSSSSTEVKNIIWTDDRKLLEIARDYGWKRKDFDIW